MPSYDWHVKLAQGVLPGLLGTWARNRHLSRPVESNSPPEGRHCSVTTIIIRPGLTLGKGYYSRAECLGHCDLRHLCAARKTGVEIRNPLLERDLRISCASGRANWCKLAQTGANWRKLFQPGANRRKSVQTIAKQAQLRWPPTVDKRDSPSPSHIMHMSITSPRPQRSLGSERLSAFRATSCIVGIATRNFSRKVVFAPQPTPKITPPATYLTATPELRPPPGISAN